MLAAKHRSMLFSSGQDRLFIFYCVVKENPGNILAVPFKTLSENLLLETRLKGSKLCCGSSFIISCSVFPLQAEKKRNMVNLNMKNINTLMSVMREYYNTALKNTYDCDDARTFKTICPRCNRARTLTVSVNCSF